MFSPPSVAASTTSNVSSRPAQHSKSLTASNINLFLSNVRLLNLDKLPDWPIVDAKTFDTKDAAQNQRKRVSSVEWLLYRLFQILDPALTREVCCPVQRLQGEPFSFSHVEITAFLSTLRATAVHQSSGCLVSLLQ